MADDFGTLLDTIADESRRPRATFGTQIAACVQEAIDDYSREGWWFVELNSTFTTVASQEYYTSSDAAFIANILEFDSVVLTIGGTDKRLLTKQSWQWIEDINHDGSSTGQPSDYAYRDKKIRLYSIPTGAWATRVRGKVPLTRLSADADTNPWVTRGEGEALIRYRASALFYGTYLRLGQRAGEFQSMADVEKNKLTASLSRRQATGRIRPSL